MGMCNIEYKGKYACSSSISDGFVTEFMDRLDYEKWRADVYGENLRPIDFNLKSMEEAAFSIRLNRSHDEAVDCLVDCGLSKEESEEIIYGMETKYYVPILKDNGKFECPNCKKDIENDQLECDDDMCSLEFVWRI